MKKYEKFQPYVNRWFPIMFLNLLLCKIIDAVGEAAKKTILLMAVPLMRGGERAVTKKKKLFSDGH